MRLWREKGKRVKQSKIELDGIELEKIVREKRIKCLFDLASAMQLPHTHAFDDSARNACPGIESLMRRFDAMSSLAWARKEGLDEMAKEFGAKIVEETMEWARSGGALHMKKDFLDLPSLAVKAKDKLIQEFEKSPSADGTRAEVKLWKLSQKPTSERKPTLKAPTGEKLEVLKPGEIEGEAIAACVLGRTGEEYFGREVYIVRMVNGMFGTTADLEYTYRCTAVNGIVNQYPLTAKPSRFWIVMDVASELKDGFGKDKFLTRAMERMSELGVECPKDECLIAWDIVKNHQFRKRKDGLCMGFIVEEHKDLYRVRARNADETASYFAEVKKRADHRVERTKRVERIQPTEERPVSVVVEQMR
jgi:hypothetical protein